MDNKSYTILIASNRRGHTKSVTISAAWLKTFAFLGVVGAMIFGAVAVDYVGLLLKAGENKRLRAENTKLKKQFQVIDSKVSTLEDSIDRVKNYSKKLKLITNVKDKDRATRLAIGPMPKAGQSYQSFPQPGKGKRRPASEFMGQQNNFMNQAPLDQAGEELATQRTEQKYSSLSVRIDRAVKEARLREQGVLQLWERLSERQSLLNATPSIQPAQGWFTSRFGYRLDPFTGQPTMHTGVDMAAPPGTRVKAPAEGVVSRVGYESGYGKTVSIDHGYGVVTRYAHNSQVYVEEGDKVSRRDPIAAIGSTGRSSGPHLHYEIRVNGVPVDPMNYILNTNK